MTLICIPLSGLNFDTRSWAVAASHFGASQSHSRPFDGLQSEKISIDFGPWFRQVRELFGSVSPQVRIRPRKNTQSYTLESIIDRIVAHVSNRLEHGIPQGSLPGLSCWRFIGLRQKMGRRDHRASFECVFEVQGHTRGISSTEEDIELVLRELLSPYPTSQTPPVAQQPPVPVVIRLDPLSATPHRRQLVTPVLQLESHQPLLVYIVQPIPQSPRVDYTPPAIGQMFYTNNTNTVDAPAEYLFAQEQPLLAEESEWAEDSLDALMIQYMEFNSPMAADGTIEGELPDIFQGGVF